MPQRDGLSNKRFRSLFEPKAAVANDTAIVSAIIDTLGYDAVSLVFQTGTNADADMTATVLVEEGDDSGLSDAAAVADDDMVSQTPGTAAETAAAFGFADDNEVRAVGYIGSKRYVRVTVTPANNLGNQFLAGLAILEGKSPAFATLASA